MTGRMFREWIDGHDAAIVGEAFDLADPECTDVMSVFVSEWDWRGLV